MDVDNDPVFYQSNYRKYSSANNSPQTLGYDVEKGENDANLTAKHKAKGHGRIDVAAANMAKGLSHRSHSDAKGQADTNDVRRGVRDFVPRGVREDFVTNQTRATSNDDQKHNPDELGDAFF